LFLFRCVLEIWCGWVWVLPVLQAAVMSLWFWEWLINFYKNWIQGQVCSYLCNSARHLFVSTLGPPRVFSEHCCEKLLILGLFECGMHDKKRDYYRSWLPYLHIAVESACYWEILPNFEQFLSDRKKIFPIWKNLPSIYRNFITTFTYNCMKSLLQNLFSLADGNLGQNEWRFLNLPLSVVVTSPVIISSRDITHIYLNCSL